jgi:hypothetical protein
MSLRYQVKAQGLSGIPYRADIYDVNFGGSSTEIRGDRQFVVIEGSAQSGGPDQPLWVKDVSLYVRDDVDLSALFSTKDRDVRVELIRTDSNHKVFEGYVLADLINDSPYQKLDVVELEVIDGLSLLKSQGLGDIYSSSTAEATYADAITSILSELYPSPLDVEFGVEWYPDDPNLSSSDCPLRYLEFALDNYRSDRPEGEFLSLFEVLKDLCRGQGLEVRQVQPAGEDALWHVRQPSAVAPDGSIKTWRFNPDGTLQSGEPATRTYYSDLSSEDFDLRHTRELKRRVQAVSVVHDHVPIENLIAEGGFEDQGAEWTLNSDSNYETKVVKHDNSTTPIGSTQDNTYVLEINQTSTPASESIVTAVSQNLGLLSGFPPRTYGQLDFTHLGDQGVSNPALEIGGWYLDQFVSGVRQSVKQGTGTLPVQPIDRPIPEGAEIPIVDASTGPRPEGTIRLNQRAPKNASKLVGEISVDVDSSWEVRYPGFVSSDAQMPITSYKEDSSWQSGSIRFELVDSNGNLLSGDVNFELRFLKRISTVSLNPRWDDLSLSLERDGQPLTKTKISGSVLEAGDSISISTRTTQGPTAGNLSRLRGITPGGSDFRPTGWGIGAGGGSLKLEELHAREWLRYFRENTQILDLEFQPRDKAPVLSGQEIVTFDGKDYRIRSIEYKPYNGRLRVRLLEHKDRGTSGISYGTGLSAEETSGGVSSGGVTCAALTDEQINRLCQQLPATR